MKGLIAVLFALVILGLAFFLYSSPSAPPEMTDAERAQVQAEVLQTAQAWMTGWHDMDTDCETAFDLMDPDHFVWFWRGSRIDRDGFLEYCTASTRNRTGYDGAWTDTDVRVLSPDAALFVGSYDGTFEHADGTSNHYPTGGQIILFERTATGWRVTTLNNFNGPAEVVEGG